MINQNDLAYLISEEMNVDKKEISKVLRKFMRYLVTALSTGEDVKTSFGIFRVEWSKQKYVQDFSKNERYLLPPRKKIVFYPAMAIKNSLNKLNTEIQEKVDQGIDVVAKEKAKIEKTSNKNLKKKK